MIILNSLFPVFLLIVLGIAIKRFGLTDETFLKQSDRLIYYIFFPVMLFYKIGGASYGETIDWTFCLVTLLVITAMFLLSTMIIMVGPVTGYEAGSFSQSCYRFNTYIGVAVILNSLGEAGVALFGVMIGMAIPLINFFAVSLLIWYSGEELNVGRKLKMLIKALAANPLILGCLAGIGYSRLLGSYPLFIDNALQLMSMVTLPLALLSIGGSLTFKGVQKYLSKSLLASALKLLVLPLIGYGAYSIFGVSGIGFKVGMIFFCLPASTAIYVLSSQMNSDTELASSAIVVSTLLSFFPLSLALLL